MSDLKVINVRVRPEHHELLRELSDEAHVSQGVTMGVLLEMALLIAGVARESGALDPDSRMPALEVFALWTANRAGLLGDAEMRRGGMVAQAMEAQARGRLDLRLRALASLVNERIDQLRPIWATARAARDAAAAAEWEAAVNAAAAMLGQESLAGSSVSAGD